MKMLAVILSLFTIFLSSYPCCQDEDSCAEILTIEYNSGDGSQKEVPHDSDGPCSPFYNCGRCVGFTLTFNEMVLVPIEHELKKAFVPYLRFQPKEALFIALKPPRYFEI